VSFCILSEAEKVSEKGPQILLWVEGRGPKGHDDDDGHKDVKIGDTPNMNSRFFHVKKYFSDSKKTTVLHRIATFFTSHASVEDIKQFKTLRSTSPSSHSILTNGLSNGL
jgi:hypothetical protein